MRVCEHADDRGTLQPPGFHVPAVARQHRMTRGGQRGDMRHLAAGDKGIAAIGRQP